MSNWRRIIKHGTLSEGAFIFERHDLVFNLEPDQGLKKKFKKQFHIYSDPKRRIGTGVLLPEQELIILPAPFLKEGVYKNVVRVSKVRVSRDRRKTAATVYTDMPAFLFYCSDFLARDDNPSFNYELATLHSLLEPYADFLFLTSNYLFYHIKSFFIDPTLNDMMLHYEVKVLGRTPNNIGILSPYEYYTVKGDALIIELLVALAKVKTKRRNFEKTLYKDELFEFANRVIGPSIVVRKDLFLPFRISVRVETSHSKPIIMIKPEFQEPILIGTEPKLLKRFGRKQIDVGMAMLIETSYGLYPLTASKTVDVYEYYQKREKIEKELLHALGSKLDYAEQVHKQMIEEAKMIAKHLEGEGKLTRSDVERILKREQLELVEKFYLNGNPFEFDRKGLSENDKFLQILESPVIRKMFKVLL